MCYSLWYIIPQAVTHSLVAPEDGQNNCPKHVELTGIINKPLLLNHAPSSKYQIEIYMLIKHIKSVLWRVATRLSYIEDARCLKVKVTPVIGSLCYCLQHSPFLYMHTHTICNHFVSPHTGLSALSTLS